MAKKEAGGIAGNAKEKVIVTFCTTLMTYCMYRVILQDCYLVA